MYSEYKNITIYLYQINIEWKNGDFMHMKLTHPFIPYPDEVGQWESDDGRYGLNYQHSWIVIFDRKLKKYTKVFCPREVCTLIRKFTTAKEVPFELQYCKHLFWKYDKKAISIYFTSKVDNEDEIDKWIREYVAPKHSTGVDNQPIAVVYKADGGFWQAAVLKSNRLVDVVHVPVAREAK